MQKPIIAINYYFGQNELNNQIFAPNCNSGAAVFMKDFRSFMNQRGVEVMTLDTVDFHDPNVKYVVYFDYNWRLVRSDPFLDKIPYAKRALVMIEPANINPSLYYISTLRNRFSTVFTWDLNLLRKNPSYSRINVPVGAEPRSYKQNIFNHIQFDDKRLLVAVSSNRWSYMPQSTFSLRRKYYRYFERMVPEQFDLYGIGWNKPCAFYQKWFGFHKFSSWRGLINGTFEAKVNKIANYKFALCFENNASEPGYISEKITDCFCARCVPIYYGSKGTEEMIPSDAWINLRDFRNLDELRVFLSSMDEGVYNRYITAIDRFMQSESVDYFSCAHLYQVIAERLGFPLINDHGMKKDIL